MGINSCFPRYKLNPKVVHWIDLFTQMYYHYIFGHSHDIDVTTDELSRKYLADVIVQCQKAVTDLRNGLLAFESTFITYQKHETPSIDIFWNHTEEMNFFEEYMRTEPTAQTDEDMIQLMTTIKARLNESLRELETLKHASILAPDGCPVTRQLFATLFNIMMIEDTNDPFW